MRLDLQPMATALQKIYPGLNLDEAKDQVRIALRHAVDIAGGTAAFLRALNPMLERLGRKQVSNQGLNWWLVEGQFLHESYWPLVEEITAVHVTRRYLAPHVYGLMRGYPRSIGLRGIAAVRQAVETVGGPATFLKAFNALCERDRKQPVSRYKLQRWTANQALDPEYYPIIEQLTDYAVTRVHLTFDTR